ncbi:MAG: gliding motility-associated C-terminal domain-containing protein, partial [Bacteroidota bacterium]
CNGDNTGSLDVSANGGVPPYVYSLDGINFQAGNSFSNLLAGSYTFTVRDSNLCEQSLNLSISEPPLLDVSIASQSNVDCNGNATGSVVMNGAGGVPPYQFALDNGPFGTQNTFSNLSAGTYTVFIRDANLCVDSIAIVITEPPVLSGSIVQQKNVRCAGLSDGWIDIAAAGGTPPYQYAIDGSPLQTSSVFSNLAAGSYQISIQDDSACVFQFPISITEPTNLQLSLQSQQNVDCFGNATAALLFNGNGGVLPYLYQIDGGAFQTSPNFSALTAGTYQIVMQDDSLCTDTLDIQVSQPDSLTIAVDSILNVDCNGNATGSVWFQANGGTLPYQFTLSDSITGTVSPFINLPAGTYQLEVEDDRACAATVSLTITEPDVLLADSTDQIDVACFGDSSGQVSILVQGGTLPYQYSVNNGNFGNDSIISNLPAGSHLVVVQDANGCLDSVNLLISQPAPLLATVVDSLHVDCFGNATGLVRIGAMGGVAPYEYSIDGVNFQVSDSFTFLPAGQYQFTIRDDSSCTASVDFIITEPNELILQTDSLIMVDCNGNSTASIHTSANGGTLPYLYALDGGAFQASGSFRNLPAGAYEVVIEDAQGCRDTLSQISITEPDVLTATTSPQNVLCHGTNSGQVSAIANGGTAPYQYLWSDGQTSIDALNLFAGAYTVEITDDQGCTASALAFVDEPDTLVLNWVRQTDPFCDWPNGSATVIATGGLGAYQYSWDSQPPQFQATADSLPGGLFIATVMDGNGCTDTLSVFMNNTPPAIPDFSGTPNIEDSILLSEALIQFQNQTIGGVAYQWDFGDGGMSDQENPRYQYSETGVYEVELTAFDPFFACPTTITKTIHIIPDGILYMPTAFTPNNDGINDEFYVPGEGMTRLSLVIYSRWGREVGRLSAPDQKWDGRLPDGTPAPEGVYTYALSASFNSGKILKRGGTITLYR